MSNSSIKINESTLKRLRLYLAKKYGGELYGKISETASKAINEYLDRHEISKKEEKI